MTGTVVAATDEKRVQSGANLKTSASKALKPLLDGLFAGSIGGGAFMDTSSKSLKIAAYRPVPNTDWSVLCIAPYDDFYHGLSVMLHLMTLTLIVILVVAVLASIFTAHSTVQPILAVKNAVTEIASGDADLAKRINSNAKDEIGDVVIGFNSFTGKLHEIISQVKNSKESLGMAGEDLSAST